MMRVMTAKDLATALGEWLQEDWVEWEGPTDVVEWARPFGSDVDRAWASAERPGHLMAIAGLYGADPVPVIRVAAACVRDVLVHVPAKEGRPRKAVYLAEAWRP